MYIATTDSNEKKKSRNDTTSGLGAVCTQPSWWSHASEGFRVAALKQAERQPLPFLPVKIMLRICCKANLRERLQQHQHRHEPLQSDDFCPAILQPTLSG